MPKKRKLTEEPAITLWVRERYGYPPIPITCKKSDTIAHLVGRSMKTFYPKGATKSGYIIAQHNNVTIHHKTKLGDVRDVSAEDPIILDQHVPCKYFVCFRAAIQILLCSWVTVGQLYGDTKYSPHIWQWSGSSQGTSTRSQEFLWFLKDSTKEKGDDNIVSSEG